MQGDAEACFRSKMLVQRRTQGRVQMMIHLVNQCIQGGKASETVACLTCIWHVVKVGYSTSTYILI
jgi:hypothetical protein